jgi:hypothetical protein
MWKLKDDKGVIIAFSMQLAVSQKKSWGVKAIYISNYSLIKRRKSEDYREKPSARLR